MTADGVSVKQRFALFFDERKLLKTKTLAHTSIEEFQLTRAKGSGVSHK